MVELLTRSPFNTTDNIYAVAVSGGPDSMALAHHLAQWAVLEKKKLLALVVNHALRPESGDEAKQTALWLKKMGIAAKILVWTHGRLTTRLQASARAARYKLMQDACKKHGIRQLFLAHHADDQMETVLMRMLKGSGPDGLQGMGEASTQGTLTLRRPLLDLRKKHLLAYCKKNNIPFHNDPSNANPQFGRTAMRDMLGAWDKLGWQPHDLAYFIRRQKMAAEALEFSAHHFSEKLMRQDRKKISLHAAGWASLPDDLKVRLLESIIDRLQPRTYAPKLMQVMGLCTAMTEALAHQKNCTKTLGKCLFTLKKGMIVVETEKT